MLGSLATLIPSAAGVLASSGGFLIEPGVGLMVWTLLVFGATMFLLSKLAFPRISDALGRRQRAIEDSIDTAERTRAEADEILAEYRERLKEARAQAEEIVQRARQAAEAHEHEAKDRGQELLAQATRRAERDIEAASRRALQDIRREVADLTIMATEKVTRRTLTDADQRRLVEEALSELDFESLAVSTPAQAGAEQG
jgi:F-type H+-transporting ATPase subunit b